MTLTDDQYPDGAGVKNDDQGVDQNAGSDDPGRRGWVSRMRAGLSRSSGRLATGVGDIFSKKKLDQAALGELEELLIGADLGVATAAKLVSQLADNRFDRDVGPEMVRRALANDIATILDPVARPFQIDAARRPHIVLVVGVNGTGKTTTIGKLAQIYRRQGASVLLAAADTFRAAAIDQLEKWGERVGVDVFADAPGADPASVAYRAVDKARADSVDVLFIDTAGRLHNKSDLMAELEKICRVLGKLDPDAPHDCLMVLDATTGQNAHNQVEYFKDLVAITGLVVTKLDGSAKGGVIVGLADRFGLPIHAIGVGEGPEDLQPFEARDFAEQLLGLGGTS
jgi:fused signal recognition particle receptor